MESSRAPLPPGARNTAKQTFFDPGGEFCPHFLQAGLENTANQMIFATARGIVAIFFLSQTFAMTLSWPRKKLSIKPGGTTKTNASKSEWQIIYVK